MPYRLEWRIYVQKLSSTQENNPETFPTWCLTIFVHLLMTLAPEPSGNDELIRAPYSSQAEYWESSNRGKHMLFVPCDKHIKSSSQEKASLLAAVVWTRCQQEPEDKTMEENKRRRKERSKISSTKATTLIITPAATRKQEAEYEWEEK